MQTDYPSQDEVKSFFFKAMLKGWAAIGNKIKIAEMPGYKAIPYRDGDLSLLDNYCVTPNSNYSAGTKTIWYKDNPIWFMSYYGNYFKDAIPIVQKALYNAYQNGVFYGGRGVPRYYDNDLVYINEQNLDDFTNFSGSERVVKLRNREGDIRGFHFYGGIALVPLK